MAALVEDNAQGLLPQVFWPSKAYPSLILFWYFVLSVLPLNLGFNDHLIFSTLFFRMCNFCNKPLSSNRKKSVCISKPIGWRLKASSR